MLFWTEVLWALAGLTGEPANCTFSIDCRQYFHPPPSDIHFFSSPFPEEPRNLPVSPAVIKGLRIGKPQRPSLWTQNHSPRSPQLLTQLKEKPQHPIPQGLCSLGPRLVHRGHSCHLQEEYQGGRLFSPNRPEGSHQGRHKRVMKAMGKAKRKPWES